MKINEIYITQQHIIRIRELMNKLWIFFSSIQKLCQSGTKILFGFSVPLWETVDNIKEPSVSL